ncbi:hypothetical protein FA13DRAFT_199694 [Coprinellus micaceus]|uniref:Fungal pheromone STE3G-protein-coupled receptor n=1 Tax=Coprinellus micaceus TaxID=71717 RepID=A0A4Y7THC6_COPMI|nr:hypothetical protein FA13DRAFT_199694 [Coprinellus micaceus]
MSDTEAETPLGDDFYQDQLRGYYVVIHFALITLAIQLVLCILGASHYKAAARPSEGNSRRPYFILSFAILTLFTVACVSDSVFFANLTINRRGVSIAEFWQTNFNVWYGVMGTICNTIVILLGDGVLVYRCYYIWPERRWVVIVPSLALFASTVCGVLTLIGNFTFLDNLLGDNLNSLASAWTSLSAATNCLLTALIAGKLIYHRRKLSAVIDPSHLLKYTAALAILVESALPLALFGIVAAAILNYGTWRLSDATMTIIPAVWFCLSALCPQLIIFRVAVGTSYPSDGAFQTPSRLMKFV